ncbi:MAG: AAA family ATPase [bacterium]|nr:AAA family ATPase [bacterium]
MIVGHTRNIRYFETVLAKGTFAHAYLFHGPEAVGKRTVALAVAQALLCSGMPRNKLEGCLSDRPASPELQRGEQAGGGCEDCRLMAGGRHPDFILLSFEHLLVDEDLKREIGIKNIHELQRLLALTPWRGGRKIVLIDGADALSRDARTALLKTLEEPQPATVFFLITDRPDALPPTIRSRSITLGFAPVADGEITPLIATLPPARQKQVLAFAAGRPGLALRLAGDQKFFGDCRAAQAGFAAVLGAGLDDQFLFTQGAGPSRAEASTAAAKDGPGALEDFFEWLIRRERSELLTSLSSAAVPGGRAAFIRSLLEKLALMESTTVNRRLVADSVFVELATRV